ncbi:Short-chain dehydrogenase iccH [Paramyrothecium foliicola]|nr:Short-chain dehydrogenase iccH [Paramyrothecium foliicola]
MLINQDMAGTIILTGANGSLGVGYVRSLLNLYPDYTLVATVRNASAQKDANTAKLLEAISKKPCANVIVETLDLGVLSDVRAFADKISSQIAAGTLPPISAIVCNAFTWSLNGVKHTPDGNEATFQVSHLAHYLLVLKLLGSMHSTSGRIIMLGSTAHYPENPNPLSKLVAQIPENIDDLIKPPEDNPSDQHDRGFQRYGTAKLANVIFAYDLNRRLQADPRLSTITVVAVDPGGLIDSRAHSEQRPVVRTAFTVISRLMPVLKHLTTAVRTSDDSGTELVQLSVGVDHASKRGYFVGLQPASPAKLSQDQELQERLWRVCWKWTGMEEGETLLQQV